jgi:acyl-CoA synthetase (AMP-forming)/AMP-acid ligase II
MPRTSKAAGMEVNYFGVLNMTRAFAPVPGANGGGYIANVLSVAGRVPGPVHGRILPGQGGRAVPIQHHPLRTGRPGHVYPAEVESVMTGHPAVAEVAVVGVPSAEWGESPYAVVVLRSGTQISADELISWTKDRLAHYKSPVGVTFALSLARTASGKAQKQAIRSSLGPPSQP